MSAARSESAGSSALTLDGSTARDGTRHRAPGIRSRPFLLGVVFRASWTREDVFCTVFCDEDRAVAGGGSPVGVCVSVCPPRYPAARTQARTPRAMMCFFVYVKCVRYTSGTPFAGPLWLPLVCCASFFSSLARAETLALYKPLASRAVARAIIGHRTLVTTALPT